MVNSTARNLDLADISRAIQARHLQTLLTDARTVRYEDPAADVAALLTADQFDSAPVIGAIGPVGIFHAHGAHGPSRTVGEAMPPLDAALLVSADTPLGELIDNLAEEPFLFVVQGRKLTGFITPSDLGSTPARTHFYLQLSGLEIRLADLVRTLYPGPRQVEALDLLTDARRANHAKLVEELRNKDEFLDDVAALSLVDLLRIADANQRLRMLVAEGGLSWGAATGGLPGFRDDVMHPARPLSVSDAAGVRKLAARDRSITALTRAAEALIASTRADDADAEERLPDLP